MEVGQRRDIGSSNLIGESQDGVCTGNGNKIKMLEFFMPHFNGMKDNNYCS